MAETNQWKSSSKKVDHLSLLNAVHPYPHPPHLQSSSTRFQNHVISVLEAGEGGITGHQSGDMPWIWLRPGEGPVSSLRLVIDAWLPRTPSGKDPTTVDRFCQDTKTPQRLRVCTSVTSPPHLSGQAPSLTRPCSAARTCSCRGCSTCRGHPKWQSTSLIRMKNATWKKASIVFFKKIQKHFWTYRFFHIKRKGCIMQLFGACLKYITPPNIYFILPASADVPSRARPPRPTAKSMRPHVKNGHGPWWKTIKF